MGRENFHQLASFPQSVKISFFMGGGKEGSRQGKRSQPNMSLPRPLLSLPPMCVSMKQGWYSQASPFAFLHSHDLDHVPRAPFLFLCRSSSDPAYCALSVDLIILLTEWGIRILLACVETRTPSKSPSTVAKCLSKSLSLS